METKNKTLMAYNAVNTKVLEAHFKGEKEISFKSIKGLELKALNKLIYNGVVEELGRARGTIQEDGSYEYCYKVLIKNVKAKAHSWNETSKKFDGEMKDVIPYFLRQKVYLEVNKVEV